MTHVYEMVDQNILLYEARLKHIDEFYDEALQLMQNNPDIDIEPQLIPIKATRESLSNLIKSAKADLVEQHKNGSLQAQHSLLWQEIAMDLERLLKPFEKILPIVHTPRK